MNKLEAQSEFVKKLGDLCVRAERKKEEEGEDGNGPGNKGKGNQLAQPQISQTQLTPLWLAPQPQKGEKGVEWNER